jgi:cephalosporin-C deacetylase-like acetyl esterase
MIRDEKTILRFGLRWEVSKTRKSAWFAQAELNAGAIHGTVTIFRNTRGLWSKWQGGWCPCNPQALGAALWGVLEQKQI